jgi:spermidine synthase
VALDALGRASEARDAYREALRLDPDLVGAANNLAWMLAVSADPAVRDPEAAVRLAESALARRPGDAGVLDTLAAAQAAAGRFPEAIAAAGEAIERTQQAGQTALAQEMMARRRLYREGKPYVERR